MTSIKAILTGDIVNSTLLNEKKLDELLFAIKTELKWQNAKNDFYRGDSFHALCEASEGLNLALRLRTIARQGMWQNEDESIDIRIAIGIGNVEEPVKSMATAKGEAFVISGRELDTLVRTSDRLSIRCADEKIDPGLQGIAVLADMLTQKMSAKQSEAISELLTGATQTETAKKLRKSQSTINKLAQSANWKELERSVEIYRKLVSLIK